MIDASLLISGLDYSVLPNSPTVPNPQPLTIGTLYTFQQAGAQLPTHSHTDSNIHYTVVISGQFTIVRSAGTITANPGDVIDFAANDPHSVTCVQPGVILNALKYGANISSLSAEIAAMQASAAALATSVQALQTALASTPTTCVVPQACPQPSVAAPTS